MDDNSNQLPPETQKRLIKEAIKEAIREWLNDQFLLLGKWTVGGIFSAGLGALGWIYFHWMMYKMR